MRFEQACPATDGARLSAGEEDAIQSFAQGQVQALLPVGALLFLARGRTQIILRQRCIGSGPFRTTHRTLPVK